jgi:pimeloyl-ACP methyl ester carboxylesterase
LFSGIPPNTLKQQNDISQNWTATNWNGICDELTKISNPTLVIAGTNDNNVITANSLVIAGKIPGSWLIQMKDAGHMHFSCNIQIKSIEYYKHFFQRLSLLLFSSI